MTEPGSDKSRVIRADRRGPAVVRAELYDAQLAAAQVRSEAEAHAAQLRAAVGLELEHLRLDAAEERRRLRADAEAELERARADAYEQGRAEGNARAARELMSIAAARSSALREGERQLERAVMLIASKLAGRALASDPALLQSLIEPLVGRVRRAARVVLRVNPTDAAALASRLPAIRARAELDGVLELRPDASISQGGCMVESRLGELDARLPTRIAEIARALGWEPPE